MDETAAQAKVAEAAFFLGEALFDQGRYREAVAAYQESLQVGGEEPAKLSQLGLALLEAGDLQGASPPLERALKLREERLGDEHPHVATSLNSLAVLYNHQGRYSEAESLHQLSLRIREKVLGAEHSDVATSLFNLAALYYDQGRYADAELMCELNRLAAEEAGSGPAT